MSKRDKRCYASSAAVKNNLRAGIIKAIERLKLLELKK